MNWQKIDPDNLPTDEVLVSLGHYFLIGTLYRDEYGTVICEGKGGVSAFANPDYYLPLPELANTLPQDEPLNALG